MADELDVDIRAQVRHEGEWIIARLKVGPTTMEIGRIQHQACTINRALYEDFISLMNNLMKTVVEKETGLKVSSYNFLKPGTNEPTVP